MNKLPASFIKQWKSCTACALHKYARHHVIGEGFIPADVLFLGEAPGEKEDILGRPFIGPAGGILKQWIGAALEVKQFTFYITNIVACCPWEDFTRTTYRAPTSQEAASCSERLNGIIQEVQPRTIIYLGSISKKHHKPPKEMPVLHLPHPAAILHSRVAVESSVIHAKSISQLKNHLIKVLG